MAKPGGVIGRRVADWIAHDRVLRKGEPAGISSETRKTEPAVGPRGRQPRCGGLGSGGLPRSAKRASPTTKRREAFRPKLAKCGPPPSLAVATGVPAGPAWKPKPSRRERPGGGGRHFVRNAQNAVRRRAPPAADRGSTILTGTDGRRSARRGPAGTAPVHRRPAGLGKGQAR